MVKRSLDMAALEKKFQKARSRSLKRVVLPRGMTRKQFDLFIKVMEAKDSSELKDVSVEELATLFVEANNLIHIICDDSVLGRPSALIAKFERMKAVPARRRIL